MEIAGATCAVCSEHIVLTCEGKCCKTCGIAVHRFCDAENVCARCGENYQIFEPPEVDVLRDAIVPRGLRSNQGSSPVAFVGMGALAFFLWFVYLIFFVSNHH